jgi:hypothetical protein
MKAIGRCLGPLVAALVLTLAVTWPLAACLGRCIPPPPDSILTVYFLAWTGHALTTPGVRLLDAPMFAPYPHTLVLGDWMPAAAPLTAPVLLLTGNPVVAHNVLLIALYTGAAVGAAALAHRLLGARGPALVAASPSPTRPASSTRPTTFRPWASRGRRGSVSGSSDSSPDRPGDERRWSAWRRSASASRASPSSCTRGCPSAC